jgi:hypothetical protein
MCLNIFGTFKSQRNTFKDNSGSHVKLAATFKNVTISENGFDGILCASDKH